MTLIDAIRTLRKERGLPFEQARDEAIAFFIKKGCPYHRGKKRERKPMVVKHARIQLTDTGISAAMKMSEGNPGALTVVAQMLKVGAEIDPDAAFGGLAHILDLDTLGIYGPRIWMLYSDVCRKDLRITCALLRAVQLGFLRESDLNHAIDNYGEGVDIPAMVTKVEECLPKFQRAPVEER